MGWFRVVMAQVLWVDAAWCGLDNSQNVYFYGNLSTASKFGKKGVIAIAGDVILKVVLKFMKINIEVTVLEFRIREGKVLWTFGSYSHSRRRHTEGSAEIYEDQHRGYGFGV